MHNCVCADTSKWTKITHISIMGAPITILGCTEYYHSNKRVYPNTAEPFFTRWMKTGIVQMTACGRIWQSSKGYWSVSKRTPCCKVSRPLETKTHRRRGFTLIMLQPGIGFFTNTHMNPVATGIRLHSSKSMVCVMQFINRGFMLETLYNIMINFSKNKLKYLLRFRNHFLCLSSLPKSILELPGQCLHVPHSACANGSPSLSLLSPVEITHFLGGVSAGRACLLLDVVGGLSATTTSRVGLVVALSEWCGSLSL